MNDEKELPAPPPPLPPSPPPPPSLPPSPPVSLPSPSPGARWIHDIEAVVCRACHAPFTSLRRKHHCRACGGVFCASCTKQKLLIPSLHLVSPRRMPAAAMAPLSLDPHIPQRVCPACALRLQPTQTELQHTSSKASQPLSVDRRSWARYFNAPVEFSLQAEIKKAASTLLNFCDNVLEGRGDSIPRELLWSAQGLAFLTFIKCGLFFTARVGSGLVIARVDDDDGEEEGGGGGRRGGRIQPPPPRWSAPSALGCTGCGYGFSVGAEVVDVLIVLTTRAAVDVFKSPAQVCVGTELGIALGPVGRTAATDLRYPAGDGGGGGWGERRRGGKGGTGFCYGQSKGLFLGVSVEGSVLVSRPSVNRAFYGRSCTARELLNGEVAPPQAAEPLYAALREVMMGGEKEGEEGAWRSYYARHVRHRRHHSRRGSGVVEGEEQSAWVGRGVGREMTTFRVTEGKEEVAEVEEEEVLLG